MSLGKAKNGDEPSFVLIGDKVELLLNIANKHNDHNRHHMALNEILNEYKQRQKSFRDHSFTPRHYILSILAPISLKIDVDVAAHFKISR